mmetsp:Transcript_34922/g.56071  ORF Transcript_34922/g.56071 Transcript_34922/m.56071 type:complete len:278 (+) Transcript_34922:47-880(+)|eukprot:CAMPEP_0197072286 /NCGR_PEP_ID=MMETSP1384-20130603/210020_1 /TAXON_ID=29189 /ORGANISM="Ammonia sp." /LENGTH=277 /DNA_ID=CAMNT_0042511103 /DNA_START=53 /DNA_END=889 /DNA_ORIENTATION=+
MASTNNTYRATKEFLDSHQYTQRGILRYEKIFGKGFISTGGLRTTREFVDKYLNLRPGQKVLDVGCGIGGSALYMAKVCGADVLGVDYSDNMLETARQRLREAETATGQKYSVRYEMHDVTKSKFPENSFDVIYSRDCILHIGDKPALFKSFFKWLKPGGTLFITDYCRGPPPGSKAFQEYLKDREYQLVQPHEYTQCVRDAGFVNVVGKDVTDKFVQVLQRELKYAEAIRDEYIVEFTEKDYNYIVDGWKAKLVRVDQGDHKWGLFYAKKPLRANL